MEPQTTECSASVWPHRHTDEMSGPLDVKISFRNQPPIVRGWAKNRPVWIQLDQPDARTNLTLLRIMFNSRGSRFHPSWYRVSQCRLLPDGTLKLYIKARIIKTVPHPIPRGKWDGSCEYTDHTCQFTFQAMTMKVKPRPPLIVETLPDGSLPDIPNRRIILPDGTLPAKKKIKLVIP